VYDDQSVRLNWTTLSETDNDFFSVERYTQNSDWEVVGTLQGAGDSNAPLNYSFVDSNPPGGFVYYRLKQTDFDGTFTYSNTILIDPGNVSTASAIYPNPVRDRFTIAIDGGQERKFIISNSLGQTFDLPIVYGVAKTEVDVSLLSEGVYFLNILGRNSSDVVPFVKTN
jgi:hypothetical protein